MLRAWTFVIVGLNLSLLLLAVLLASAASYFGVAWRTAFVTIGVVYILPGVAIIGVVWRGGRSTLLEEVGASLLFAGSVCLIVAAILPWLEYQHLWPFDRRFPSLPFLTSPR